MTDPRSALPPEPSGEREGVQPHASGPRPQDVYASGFAPPAGGVGYAPYGAMSPTPGARVGSLRPQGRGWIVALVAVILLFLLLFFAMASCAAVATSALGGTPFSSSSSTATSDSVAVIPISGTIGYDGSNASPEGLRSQLKIAAEDPLIKAVVLRVNSGGGTATAGEEMAAYVRDFEKPIVVSSASMNASAAYELSSQADYIFTAKTSALGAIGTAMQMTDISVLLEKLGITMENITSSEAKDSSYGTRPLTDEERAYYQAMVDQINANFIAMVAEGRSMTVEEVSALATGLTFTGVDAVENGLADEIGFYDDAIDKAAELAGIEHPATVTLQAGGSSFTSLLDVIGRDESDRQALEEGIVQ